jgi:lipopolysaccharide biosynthesis protein
MKTFAYYLPQFHPTPENNLWWGDGFTEWTNVKKAKPLYPGHKQPRIPGLLGYYDLRDINTMHKQAAMAKSNGVDGFVFYHYWFGKGKLMLHQPLQDFLLDKAIDIGFCLCWANESWKGTWHGAGNRMLIEQTYGDVSEYKLHFAYMLPFFKDDRHFKIDGKPVLQIYMPQSIPNLKLFIDVFRSEAINNGLAGIYLMGVKSLPGWDFQANGLDGVVFNNYVHINKYHLKNPIDLFVRYFLQPALIRKIFKLPKLLRYAAVRRCLEDFPVDKDFDWFPMANSDWDNTPRTKHLGSVFLGATPFAFYQHILKCMQSISSRKPDKQIVFIRAWNEWAEGNCLEPDSYHGMGYLEAVNKAKKYFEK